MKEMRLGETVLGDTGKVSQLVRDKATAKQCYSVHVLCNLDQCSSVHSLRYFTLLVEEQK